MSRLGRSSFFPLVKKEFTALMRTYKLLIMGAVFLFFGLSSPVLARYMPEMMQSMQEQMNVTIQIPPSTYLDAVDQFIKNISQVISIMLIFLFMGIVAGEKSSGTALFVLVKPVSRAKFFLAKLTALWIPIIVLTSLAASGCYLYTILLFGKQAIVPFLSMTCILILFLLWLVTLVLFFSTVLNASAAAAACSFLTWIVFSILPSLGKLGRFSPAMLINLAETPFTGKILYLEPFLTTGGLIVFFIIGGILIFRKWEP